MAGNDLALATAGMCLVSAMVSLALLASRYWKYMLAKNGSRDPADPRWTLALVDTKSIGRDQAQNKWTLDLDHRKMKTRCCHLPSVRSKIEEVASNGGYLTWSKARKQVRAATAPILNYDVAQSGFRMFGVRHLALVPGNQGEAWRLAPLMVANEKGEESEIDISELKSQVEMIAAGVMSNVSAEGPGKYLIESLTLCVVDLAPGESAAYDSGGWSKKLVRTCCFNKVSAPNVCKDFTSLAYTRGESNHRPGACGRLCLSLRCQAESRPGKNLPFTVTKLTTFVGSLLLLAIWAAFFPKLELVIQNTNNDPVPNNCSFASADDADGLCTAERIDDAVSSITEQVHQLTNYKASVEQNKTTSEFLRQLQKDIRADSDKHVFCPKAVAYRTDPVIMNLVFLVEFPVWCQERLQKELNWRRTCCVDYTYSHTVDDRCQTLSQLGLTNIVPGTVSGIPIPNSFRQNILQNQVCLQNFRNPSVVGSTSGTAGGSSQGVCGVYGTAPGVHRPCPTGNLDQQTRALDDEQSRFSAYNEDRTRRDEDMQNTLSKLRDSKLEPFEFPTVSDEVREVISDLAAKLKERIRIASDWYIGYCICRLWFPSALLMNSSPWTSGVRRTVFGQSRRVFVLAVVLLWWGMDMVKYLEDLNAPNLRLYLANIAVEPCFLDTSFHDRQVRTIESVCREMREISVDIGIDSFDINKTYGDIVDFGKPLDSPNPANIGCGCNYDYDPGYGLLAAMNMTKVYNFSYITSFVRGNLSGGGLRPFVGNLTFCNSQEMWHELLDPRTPDISWWEIWLSLGGGAELLLKFTLVNLCYALIGLVDPLVYIGGRYEVHALSEPLSNEAQDEIALLLSQQHLRDSVLWAFLTVIAICNLFASGWRDHNRHIEVATNGTECTLERERERDERLGIIFGVSSAAMLLLALIGSLLFWRSEQRLLKAQKIVNYMRRSAKTSGGTLTEKSKWRVLQAGVSASAAPQLQRARSSRSRTPERSADATGQKDAAYVEMNPVPPAATISKHSAEPGEAFETELSPLPRAVTPTRRRGGGGGRPTTPSRPAAAAAADGGGGARLSLRAAVRATTALRRPTTPTPAPRGQPQSRKRLPSLKPMPTLQGRPPGQLPPQVPAGRGGHGDFRAAAVVAMAARPVVPDHLDVDGDRWHMLAPTPLPRPTRAPRPPSRPEDIEAVGVL
jgi:hypothetical protein